MGLLDIFRKKKTVLTEEQLKWNKMWELWTDEKTVSPFTELMTYQSEVYNGGHSQYFTNTENTGNLNQQMSALSQILSEKMNENLNNAYKAYLALEKNEADEKAEEAIKRCDEIFYKYEEEINKALEEYALKIEL